MTPQEKADELVRAYRGFEMPNEKIASVQCAIIAVQEVVESLTDSMGDVLNEEYWQEVLQHLKRKL